MRMNFFELVLNPLDLVSELKSSMRTPLGLCVSMLVKRCRTSMRTRSYREMRSLSSFEDRFDYLSLRGQVGQSTFGFDRYLNQQFYTSLEWRQARDRVIVRDLGCDLGCEGYEIHDKIIIHHLNPLTPDSIEHGSTDLFDLDNLITTTHNTHNAIHYGDKSLLRIPTAPRRRGDTRLW